MNKTRGFLLAAGIALAMAFTFSCSSKDGGGPVVPGTPVTHGGETYQTVVIGTQTWFARNLNYNAAGSKCYGEDGTVITGWKQAEDEEDTPIEKTLTDAEVQANCTKYGRLYDWSTAMALPSSCNDGKCSSQIQPKHKGICPEGWHIPSQAEWDALKSYAESSSGCSDCYDKLLKATSGWNGNDNGTDKYGFSALPGGTRYYSFEGIGGGGYWWSSSELDWYAAYMDIGGGGHWQEFPGKIIMFSVRCVKD
jgi:uncharacterized protein (TIGR02145 family)